MATMNSAQVLEMEDRFPAKGSAAEMLAFLTQYAILSPSVQHTQPWIFATADAAVLLHVDDSRARRATDPEMRDLIISCGAALRHLRIAAGHFGIKLGVEPFPAGAQNLVARITISERVPANNTDSVLFYAIHKWANSARPLRTGKMVNTELLDELAGIARDGGAWLHFARETTSRDTVAGFIAEGDWNLKQKEQLRKVQTGPVAFNRKGEAGSLGHVARYLQLFFNHAPEKETAVNRQKDMLAGSEPVLSIIGTSENTPADWLAAGQLFATVLLRALSVGVHAALLNQPLRDAEMRQMLAQKLGLAGHPQILFRMGYATRPGDHGAAGSTVNEELL